MVYVFTNLDSTWDDSLFLNLIKLALDWILSQYLRVCPCPYQVYCLPLNLMVKRAQFLLPEPDVYLDVN